MEELIRRSDVIEALKDNMVEMGGEDFSEIGVHSDDIDAIINDIPSIEPKRGHWIETPHNEKCKYIVCSECGNRYAVDVNIPLEVWIDGKHRFCGSCNADMTEREGE